MRYFREVQVFVLVVVAGFLVLEVLSEMEPEEWSWVKMEP